MADDINKKISVDIEINNDGQQQINQYNAAFDNLRSSINGIKNPFRHVDLRLGYANWHICTIFGYRFCRR
jgi:hypothetical protein